MKFKIMLIVFFSLLNIGQIAQAECERERAALQSCESRPTEPECRLNSDCSVDEICRSGTCVAAPQRECTWQELTRDERRGPVFAQGNCVSFCKWNESTPGGSRVTVTVQERNSCTNEVRSSSFEYLDCVPCSPRN